MAHSLKPSRSHPDRQSGTTSPKPVKAHQQLGLMPPAHWNAYGRFIQGYAATPGFRDGWNDVRHAFADDYVAWMNRQTAVAA